jgi:hypothetical protein
LIARQAGAYGELIAADVSQAWHACSARLWAAALLAAGAVFLVAMGCVGLLAYAWDTSARWWVIDGLAGFFLLAAAAGAIALWRLSATPLRFLPATRREWRKEGLAPEPPEGAGAPVPEALASAELAAAMARTRDELRHLIDPGAAAEPGSFPRSRTLRWILGHPLGRWLGTAMLTQALSRLTRRR